MLAGIALVGLGGLGCQSDPGSDDLVAVESNDVGVAHVQIERSTLRGDRLLEIHGFDERGDEIALLTMRSGTVLYSAEPGVIPEEEISGTELQVSVGSRGLPLVTPGVADLQVPAPPDAALASFVRLSAVATAIEKQGLTFQVAPVTLPGFETAYTAGNCLGSAFPMVGGGVSQCCRESTTGATWHKIAGGNNAEKLLHRVYGSVCRTSSGATGCGVGAAQCAYGPCGSMNSWGPIGTAISKIFRPNSNPSVCGYYVDSGNYSPEVYTSQTTYPTVAASCMCTACNTNGTPQCGFRDQFNRTTGPGSSWTVNFQSFTTDGAFLVSGGTEGPTHSATANPSPALNTNNYAITAQLSVPAGALYSGVFARDTGLPYASQNIYSAQISTQNSVNLFRRDEGAWTHLGTAPATITVGTVYTLKFVATGSYPVHLEVWLNGVQLVVHDDYSASRKTAGTVGVYTAHNGVKYDSFDVWPTAQDADPPPPPQNGSPFIDDFNRTTGLGSNWTVRWGSYTTDGAYAVAGTPPQQGNWARLVPSIGSDNYQVVAQVNVPSSSYNSGIVVRSSDPSDISKELYSGLISTSGGGQVILWRRDNWVWTQLAVVSTAITPGVTYELKVVATGTYPVHLELWLNGVLKLTYDDYSASRKTTGTLGIQNYNANVKYDYLRADAL